MIDLSRTFDKTYWAHRLHVTEQELTLAVRIVGPNSDKVRRLLHDARLAQHTGESGPAASAS